MKLRSRLSGTWYVLAAFVAWGLLPVYWKALESVPSAQILAHRIFWSFLFVLLLLWMQGRWPEFKLTFRSRRNRAVCLLTATIIGSNWFTYIWAVNHDHIVDASLGYFINPLFTVLLGVVFLRERLNTWKIVSVGLATVGVGYLTLQYGKFPWVALILAVTFGFYGLLRKVARVDSLTGLTAETAILSPLMLAFLIRESARGTGVVGSASAQIHILLVGAGLVTATPLLWYTIGVRRIPLSTAGFLQYSAPSLQLFLGVVIYNEPFTRIHWFSFSLIWAALLLYSLSTTPLLQRRSRNAS